MALSDVGSLNSGGQWKDAVAVEIDRHRDASAATPQSGNDLPLSIVLRAAFVVQ